MSWLFSRALVEEYSAGISLDGAVCALSSGAPTPQASWLPAKMTEPLRLSRSGMTCKPLTADHGEGVLMSFLRAFPAKIFRLEEKEPELLDSVAECGGTRPGSLAKWDRDTFSWRTHQYSLAGGLELFSETWPRWGIMRGGEFWALEVVADQWNASAFGLPAPTKSMGKRGWGISKVKPRYAAELEANALSFGYKPHPSVLEWAMGWTPTWTRLEPLETAKFRQWLNSHGKH